MKNIKEIFIFYLLLKIKYKFLMSNDSIGKNGLMIRKNKNSLKMSPNKSLNKK